MKKNGMILASVATVLCFALAACAPQQSENVANESKSGGGGTATEVAAVGWSPDSDCNACHTGFGDSAIALAHESAGFDCFTCHEESEMQSIHDEHGSSGKTPKRLKYSEVDFAGCLASECHVSMESLTEETTEVALIDKNGFSVNPHAFPTGIEEHETITCDNCHSMHGDEDAKENAEKKCFGCHHEEVFECGTCHSV